MFKKRRARLLKMRKIKKNVDANDKNETFIN